MLQALFNSLSGLFAFSKNLDTISNNIANMNTPGFRGGDSYHWKRYRYGGRANRTDRQRN